MQHPSLPTDFLLGVTPATSLFLSRDVQERSLGQQLARDPNGKFTVVDFSLCAQRPGRVTQVGLSLPDSDPLLPVNLTFMSFYNRQNENLLYVRAAAVVDHASQVERHAGIVTVHASLVGGKGLPFVAGDCIGWSHNGRKGLAFVDLAAAAGVKIDSAVVFGGSIPTWAISSWLSQSAGWHVHRKYALRFKAHARPDPFGCWEKDVLERDREKAKTHNRHMRRTPLTCCYVAPLMKSTDLPECFGMIQDFKTKQPVWYHPSHCCPKVSLESALIDSVRCSALRTQTPWRWTLDRIASCLNTSSMMCKVMHHALHKADDCFAAKLLISLMPDLTQPGLAQIAGRHASMSLPIEVRLHASGYSAGGVCALYGFDASECCFHLSCQDKPVPSCVACILAEIPWGHWSLAQRHIITHVVSRLISPARFGNDGSSQFPGNLHSSLQWLTDHEVATMRGSLGITSAVNQNTSRLFPILGVLLQAILTLGGPLFLYDAVHALQVTAPLDAECPHQILRFLGRLPPQPNGHDEDHSRKNRRTDHTPCIRYRQKNLAHLNRGSRCGAAASALHTLLVSGSEVRSEQQEECCVAAAWPALVRAAWEGGCSVVSVFAICVLCEVALRWEPQSLENSVAIVDKFHAQCWRDSSPCAASTWADVFGDLRGRTLCRSNLYRRMWIRSPKQRSPAHKRSSKQVFSESLRVLDHADTLKYLQKQGTSLVRMNDGEQSIIHKNFNSPVAHLGDSFFRLQFAASATCSGLCVGLLNPFDEQAVEALGPYHYDFWVNRGGFHLTQSVFEQEFMSVNRTYCFGLVTYRPKFGPGRMSKEEFAVAWDNIFQNQSVLLVHPQEGFLQNCGGCKPISDILFGGGHRLPPFRKAKDVKALNPKFLQYDRIAGREWPFYIALVLDAARLAQADTVAVVWGISADILVTELACRGLRALDIGSLISILQGGTDPDEATSDEKRRVRALSK